MTLQILRPHWGVAGPKRANAARLLAIRNVPGAHVAEVWRLFRVGPWSVFAFRYRPGQIEERNDKEIIP